MKKAIPILLLILFFAAAAWYSFMSEPDPVHEIPPPSLVLEPVVEEEPTQPWPEEAVPDEAPPPLPLLDESDERINQELAVITGPDIPAQYLVKDQVVSRLVATIDALTSRQVPAPINPVRPVSGKFIASSEGEDIIISADNHARYAGYVSLLQALDNDAVLGFYTRHYPLFQQAWEENGGEGAFNDRLLEVIDHLLATPDVDGDIHLVKPEAVYLFENPALEALSAGQKILLRMGPDNAAVVKAKLAEIRVQAGAN